MAPPPPPLRAVELQYFYRKEPKWSFSGSGDLTLSRVETAKGKVIDDEYDFHLSPLADVTAPLISTAPSLMALGNDFDQDEIVKAKQAKSPGKAHGKVFIRGKYRFFHLSMFPDFILLSTQREGSEGSYTTSTPRH
jgi:hypothetical protein